MATEVVTRTKGKDEEETALAEVSAKSVMDVLDETLIRQELAGVDVQELVYEFELAGKTVRGATAQGALAMARLAVDYISNVEIFCDEPIVEERRDSFKAKVRTTYKNTKTNSSISFWTSKVQMKDIIRKDGSVAKKDDPNAEDIAAIKVQRNGILRVFGPKHVAEFLEMFRKEGKIKKVTSDELKDAAKIAQIRGRSKVNEKEASQAKSLEDIEKPEAIAKANPSVTKPVIPSKENDDEIAAVKLSLFHWWTKPEGGSAREWKAGDSFGWANVIAQGDLVDLAKPVVKELDNNGGGILQNGELFSYEEAKGRLLRSRTDGAP